MRVSEGFQQQAYALPPPWTSDSTLRAILRRHFGAEAFKRVDEDLQLFERRLEPMRKHAQEAHDAAVHAYAPRLVQHDELGRRVDRLHTSEGWRALKRSAAEERFMEIAYDERKTYGPAARVLSFVKLFLWTPDCGNVGCPLSMTDGCARVLELLGTDDMKRDVLSRLVTSDPDTAWTAGQWMTERPGGSDVSHTETTATPLRHDGRTPETGDWYNLNGFKWFSSATDGDVSLALARTGPPGSGSRGLSLFLIELRDRETGALNGIEVHRLKNKWGTKTLPTAELSLNNTRARLIGEVGRGVPNIASVLNITRLYSAISGVSSLRRALAIASSYAIVRRVGAGSDEDDSRLLSNNSMHAAFLADAEVMCRGLTHLTMGVARMLGESECATSLSPQKAALLRLLTPATKASSAEHSGRGVLVAMEALGGLGYMDETGIGRLMQDTTVERIWEGTQNVLALDVVRVVTQSKGQAASHLAGWAQATLEAAPNSLTRDCQDSFSTANDALVLIGRASEAWCGGSKDTQHARHLLYLVALVATTVFLVEHATWAVSQHEDAILDVELIRRWSRHSAWSESSRVVHEALGAGTATQAQRATFDRQLAFGYSARCKL